MSSIIEEILTSSIGFVIAMVVLGAIIGVGLYGYWVYVNHQTLENYLWPVAEVVPLKNGTYYLGIVNTGNEPIIVEDIYTNNSKVLSVDAKPLSHNQWLTEALDSLPVAVRVCSALDPRVCEVVPVHGWGYVRLLGNGVWVDVVGSACYLDYWKVLWYNGNGGQIEESTDLSWFVPTNQTLNFIAEAYGGPVCSTHSTSTTNGNTTTVCTWQTCYYPTINGPSSVEPNQNATFTLGCGSTTTFLGCVTYSNNNNSTGGNNNGNNTNGPPNNNTNIPPITVSVSDSYGAGWSISWSGAASGSHSGSSTESFKVWPASNGTVYFTAEVTSNPSGYECTISPENVQANPGGTASFTVSCVQSPYPPCTVEPPSVSSSPSGAPQPTSRASVSSIPYNQTKTVTFTYNAPLSGNNYVFQYWNIGGQTYQNNVVNITETLTCTTPGGTLTGPSGTAYYQYQPPGTIGIDPDWIDLTQSGETYTFTWTSDWSGTGTFTWSISGLVIIYYNETPSGSVTWNGKVSLPDGTVAAQGSGYLKITNYPTPPDPFHYYECGVGGSGTVNDVSASGDSVKGTVSISCTLESIFG